MGKEHFTITEKHPYHGVNDTEAYSPICPKCREGKPDAMGLATRSTGFSQTLQCGCRYEVEPGKATANVVFCSEKHAARLWMGWNRTVEGASSYCAMHDTYPAKDEPCWRCVNAELGKHGVFDREATE